MINKTVVLSLGITKHLSAKFEVDPIRQVRTAQTKHTTSTLLRLLRFNISISKFNKIKIGHAHHSNKSEIIVYNRIKRLNILKSLV